MEISDEVKRLWREGKDAEAETQFRKELDVATARYMKGMLCIPIGMLLLALLVGLVCFLLKIKLPL